MLKFSARDPLMLVFEYVVNGNLRDFLRACRPWRYQGTGSTLSLNDDVSATSTSSNCGSAFEPPNKAALTPYNLLNFSHQIAAGMQFLAGNRIVHRDLAWYDALGVAASLTPNSRNVLVDDQLNCRISDFGLCLCDVRCHGVQDLHGPST
jgi:serine/threonine protein kinase